MLQAIIVKIVKDKLVKELIEFSGITKENQDDHYTEDLIVSYLNDHIDIPFIAEDTEEEAIRAIVELVKALLIKEL